MDTLVTVTGNLAADPVQRVTASGATVVALRVASSTRRWDREAMQFRDGDPMFISVSCWRTLAGHAFQALRKGDSVVVYGRLAMRTYDDRQGARRTVHEIEALAVGPDLARFPVDIRRPMRPELQSETAEGSAEAHAVQVQVPEQQQPVVPAGEQSEQPERPDQLTEAAA